MAITSDKTKPKFLGLQAKFAATYILLIAAVLLFLNTYPVIVTEDLIFHAKQDYLQSQAALLSSGLGGLDSVTSAGASQVMEQLSLSSLDQVIVTDRYGRIVYDTDQSAGSLGTPCDWAELREALDGQDVFRCTFSQQAFQSRSAAPVMVAGNVIGGVCLFDYDPDQADLLLSLQSNLRNISLVVCVLAALVSVVLSMAMTGRIEQLLEAIRTAREGNYSHRTQLSGHDELSQLAEEFNLLAERLETTEEVRRRFVSDASHELKTPLATIRLLTDSILQSDMPPEMSHEFIEDIGNEAERLTRITEKLLQLTRMDAQPAAPQAPIPVAPVIRRAGHMLSPLAQRSGISLRLHLEDEALAPCSEDDLYQIAFNLMENAVKYNLPSGQVDVSLFTREGVTHFLVEDTGVGVPAGELTKIFDRFYRVDKARSRAAGGTGLGLSIVRETVEAHGGTITARGREDGTSGTCFEVLFPLGEPPSVL